MLNVSKFDVVLVDFGKVKFAGEQGGIRPAVVVQNDTGNTYSDTTIVMPFTTQLKRINQPTHSLFAKNIEQGLLKDSMLLGECVRQVSVERIVKKLGKIITPDKKMEIKRVYDANFGGLI